MYKGEFCKSRSLKLLRIIIFVVWRFFNATYQTNNIFSVLLIWLKDKNVSADAIFWGLISKNWIHRHSRLPLRATESPKSTVMHSNSLIWLLNGRELYSPSWTYREEMGKENTRRDHRKNRMLTLLAILLLMFSVFWLFGASEPAIKLTLTNTRTNSITFMCQWTHVDPNFYQNWGFNSELWLFYWIFHKKTAGKSSRWHHTDTWSLPPVNKLLKDL